MARLYFPFFLNASLLCEQELSELGEEVVPDFLNMESFLIVDSGLILVLESFWLDLKDVGVGMPGPEPLCTPELNIPRVCRWDVSQVLKQLFSLGTVLKTESDISYPVRNRTNAIRNGQILRTFVILLTRTYEVAVAALESETKGEILEALHDVHDGSINRVDIQRSQGCLPLLKIMRILYEVLGFCKCFQLPIPFLNATARIYTVIS